MSTSSDQFTSIREQETFTKGQETLTDTEGRGKIITRHYHGLPQVVLSACGMLFSSGLMNIN